MAARRQRFALRGFLAGLVAGAVFVGYRVATHTGAIPRSDLGIGLAVVLVCGLAGGLAGRALGSGGD